MKKNNGLYILLAIVFIMITPIIKNVFVLEKIEMITKSVLNKKINDKESFIVYVGDIDKSTNRKLSKIINRKTSDAISDYNVYNIDKKILAEDIKNNKVIIYIEGDIQKTYKSFNFEKIEDDVNAYYLGIYNNNNTYFKVAENYAQYKKLINSDLTTMAVFGRNSCSWCNKFKPVYNAIAEKYSLDIYYFDSDSYNSTDYNKILHMNLTIPAKCSSEEKEFKLLDGFGTPLTIFTRNGKVVDCISGFKDRASLIDILKDNELIGE